jgi:uncharacterized protein YjaG (DUF416 family)
MRSSIHEIYRYVYFDVIVKRMSEVRKGIFRNTNNDNNRHKLFNMVLHMNWDYISVKKRKIKTNTQKREKKTGTFFHLNKHNFI